ncbi:hypothetical protein M426DRAFT_239075 [Hypoxylon sp. CI-4A]|nr:hypothetical protein M426DRAFT_239075 [Hypoxylon sp. CI-4A]
MIILNLEHRESSHLISLQIFTLDGHTSYYPFSPFSILNPQPYHFLGLLPYSGLAISSIKCCTGRYSDRFTIYAICTMSTAKKPQQPGEPVVTAPTKHSETKPSWRLNSRQTPAVKKCLPKSRSKYPSSAPAVKVSPRSLSKPASSQNTSSPNYIRAVKPPVLLRFNTPVSSSPAPDDSNRSSDSKLTDVATKRTVNKTINLPITPNSREKATHKGRQDPYDIPSDSDTNDPPRRQTTFTTSARSIGSSPSNERARRIASKRNREGVPSATQKQTIHTSPSKSRASTSSRQLHPPKPQIPVDAEIISISSSGNSSGDEPIFHSTSSSTEPAESATPRRAIEKIRREAKVAPTRLSPRSSMEESYRSSPPTYPSIKALGKRSSHSVNDHLTIIENTVGDSQQQLRGLGIANGRDEASGTENQPMVAVSGMSKIAKDMLKEDQSCSEPSIKELEPGDDGDDDDHRIASNDDNQSSEHSSISDNEIDRDRLSSNPDKESKPRWTPDSWMDKYVVSYLWHPGSQKVSLANCPFEGYIVSEEGLGSYIPGYQAPDDKTLAEAEKTAISKDAPEGYDDESDICDSYRDPDEAGSERSSSTCQDATTISDLIRPCYLDLPQMSVTSSSTTTLETVQDTELVKQNFVPSDASSSHSSASETTSILITRQLMNDCAPPSNQELAELMSSSPVRQRSVATSPIRDITEQADSDGDVDSGSSRSGSHSGNSSGVFSTEMFDSEKLSSATSPSPSRTIRSLFDSPPPISKSHRYLSSVARARSSPEARRQTETRLVVELPHLPSGRREEYQKIDSIQFTTPPPKTFKEINEATSDTEIQPSDFSADETLEYVLHNSPKWLKGITEIQGVGDDTLSTPKSLSARPIMKPSQGSVIQDSEYQSSAELVGTPSEVITTTAACVDYLASDKLTNTNTNTNSSKKGQSNRKRKSPPLDTSLANEAPADKRQKSTINPNEPDQKKKRRRHGVRPKNKKAAKAALKIRHRK